MFSSIGAALDECEYLVEANSFEELCLWRESSLEAADMGYDRPDTALNRKKRLEWKQKGGFLIEANNTRLSVTFVYLGKTLVGFYHPTSMIVNWNDIEEWLESTGLPNCNAMNFTHCLQVVWRNNEQNTTSNELV